MLEWIKRKLVCPFQKGDVIYAQRNNYRHYGIYAGKGKVIHYANKTGDFGFNVKVRETSLLHFSKGDIVKVAHVSKEGHRLYSPRETVSRAKSQIGKKGYNAIFNNCEHFAKWCKTGRHESRQVLAVCQNVFGVDREPREIAQELGIGFINNIADPILEFFDNIGDNITEAVGDFVYKIDQAVTGYLEEN
jgi:hypothetical protein